MLFKLEVYRGGGGRGPGRAGGRSAARGKQRFSGNQLAGWGASGGSRRNDYDDRNASGAGSRGWYDPDSGSGDAAGSAAGGKAAGGWNAVDARPQEPAGSDGGASGGWGEAADQVGSGWAGWGDAGGGGGDPAQQKAPAQRGGGFSNMAGWFSGGDVDAASGGGGAGGEPSSAPGGDGFAADPSLPDASTAAPAGGDGWRQHMSEFNDFNAPPPQIVASPRATADGFTDDFSFALGGASQVIFACRVYFALWLPTVGSTWSSGNIKILVVLGPTCS